MKSQKTKIAEYFVKYKSALNSDLNKICFRYGARIMELRKDGWIITTQVIKRGLYSYTLIRKPKKI